MKKIDLGQMITILANIGVIAGIVFLAFELQQNNNLLRAQASLGLLQNRVVFRQAAIADPEVAEFWARVYSGDQLSVVDEQRLRFFAEHAILNWQFEYGQFIDGNLPAGEFPIEVYRTTFNGRGSEGAAFREVWASWRDELRPDFVNCLGRERRKSLVDVGLWPL